MAVKLEASIRRYVGISTDTKPTGYVEGQTVRDPIPAGSSFLETDTGDIWRWNGTEWTAHESIEAAEWLAAIYGELRQLRELTELKLSGFA